MRRAVTAVLVTAVVVVLLVSFKARPAAVGQGTPAPAPGKAARHPARQRAPRAHTAAPVHKAARVRRATGQAVQTPYGVVQVAAKLRDGRLVNARTVQMTYENGHSQEIDAQAEPILHEEALAAHSAEIDLVSGATYTSEGYIRSLQSAIDAARAG